MGYKKQDHHKLRLKFNSSETIESNYSGAFQDLFALMMLNGKKNGFFLEIGANHAKEGNNTYLLEKEFNWKGISIENNELYQDSFKERSAMFVLSDALTIDYEKLLQESGCSKQIDYLSLDIDPATQTLACLKTLPLSSYRFSVITYETDYYDKRYGVETADRVKEESRKILTSHGYELLVGNLGGYEDWYIDPLVIDKELINIMKEPSEYNKYHDYYILGNSI